MLGVPKRFFRLSTRTMLIFMAHDPPISYVILFRELRGAILVVMNKINRAVHFKTSKTKLFP